VKWRVDLLKSFQRLPQEKTHPFGGGTGQAYLMVPPGGLPLKQINHGVSKKNRLRGQGELKKKSDKSEN
jgi:hypothetical protein